MKKALLTIWLVVVSVASVMSQTNHYIFHDEQQGNMVYLYMNSEKYWKLDDAGKMAVLKSGMNKYEVNIICVIDAHDVELWQMVDDTLILLDSWNKNSVKTLPSNKNKKEDQRRSLQHPWFFNLSGAINYSISDGLYVTSSTLSYNAYARLGCYLLKGRWDLALSGIIGYNKPSKDAIGTYSNSIGVDTRVYILKGKAINPFAGVGLAYAFGGSESSVTVPLTAGLSIPVKGKGCIDFCYQYNNVTKSAIIVGYTYMHK